MVAPLVLGAGISAGASLLGGVLGNAANSRAARDQMAFQERMRATQYQTAVQDLRAAGLNPMLAYTQGGAGTPSGAAARQEDVISPAVASAAQTATVLAQLQNTLADTATKEATAKEIEERTRLIAEQVKHEPYKRALTTNQGWVEHLREARDRRTYEADIARSIAESRHRNLQLPEAEASAQFWQGAGVTGSTARRLVELLPLFKLLLGRQ